MNVSTVSQESVFTTSYAFVSEVVISIKNTVVSFVQGIYNHFESIVLLTFSSFGLSALLSEIPFAVTLPMWVESPMFIPILSVMIVLLLMKIAEMRAMKRVGYEG